MDRWRPDVLTTEDLAEMRAEAQRRKEMSATAQRFEDDSLELDVEFHRLTGVTPTEWQRRMVAQIDAGATPTLFIGGRAVGRTYAFALEAKARAALGNHGYVHPEWLDKVPPEIVSLVQTDPTVPKGAIVWRAR